MRSLQMLTLLALLTTAARADIPVCSVQSVAYYESLGSGGCSMGVFTVYDFTGPLPDTIVAPNGDGFTFLGPLPPSFFSFSMSVPYTWSMSLSNPQAGEIFDLSVEEVTGVFLDVVGFGPDGQGLGHSLDFGNAGVQG